MEPQRNWKYVLKHRNTTIIAFTTMTRKTSNVISSAFHFNYGHGEGILEVSVTLTQIEQKSVKSVYAPSLLAENSFWFVYEFFITILNENTKKHWKMTTRKTGIWKINRYYLLTSNSNKLFLPILASQNKRTSFSNKSFSFLGKTLLWKTFNSWGSARDRTVLIYCDRCSQVDVW